MLVSSIFAALLVKTFKQVHISGKTAFAVSISIFGLLLFLYFLGNVQVGAQHLFKL
jgi:hypothetical protein